MIKSDAFIKLRNRKIHTRDYIRQYELNNNKKTYIDWKKSGKSINAVYSNLYYYLKIRPKYEVVVSLEDDKIYLENINDRRERLINGK